MIDISFELNGRKIKPNSFGDALEAAVLQQFSDSIKSSLRSVKCSEHHQYPKVTVKGRNLDSLSVEVSGCCDDLIEQAKTRLT